MQNQALIEEIKRLKAERRACVLAHYYTIAEIQDLADHVGDSLALARLATKVEEPVVVMCGVHFMAETVKMLAPGKTVLEPAPDAGCSLADSCGAEEFRRFIEAHPGHTVVSYVNTSAAVKALTDIVVTSGNAREIIESLPADEKIIFGPDRNLGSYINKISGREMVLWDGACHVPTAALLAFARRSDARRFIIATESGILHKMRRECEGKEFIPAPPADSTCACNDCNFMKLNTLTRLRDALRDMKPAVELDGATAGAARKPIDRMLDLSARLGL
ncbi:MAG: quinolinate synthase NadA [Muribaculaceae bacterium]|nr:quinolinate synthase NadA [Muribaculaceae bacterium]